MAMGLSTFSTIAKRFFTLPFIVTTRQFSIQEIVGIITILEKEMENFTM